MAEATERASTRVDWPGYLLGFGLGGFFDGILLHQVLQWHHLLSGVEQARQDIGVLILTDGLFHVLMYVVTAIGLWLLWRVRSDFAAPGADRRLLAAALIGFGLWHIVDGVLSHWVLGIHRIRMDVDNPLFWDLLWFAVFGIVPLVVGWLLRRGGGRGPQVASSPLSLVLAVVVAAPLAALPAPGDGPVMVLFRPGVAPAEALAAVQSVGGGLVWVDAAQQLWAIELPEGADATALYGQGALLVSNSILPLGCFDWLRA
ncbi:DUF2243 domain-containing protein [Devosia albogilva]|uniref:DUF2243 domain-containing protein n=1 Tax=Devosia albogilva TaxID=429726 RepID=A0ABW5QJJ2_9HYPH